MTSGGIFILVLLVLFWLMLIRPRRQQLRAQQRQLDSLEVGDEVLTAGGVYGTVRYLEGDEVRLEIAPEVEIRLARRAVAAVLTEKGALPPAEDRQDRSEANLPEA